MQSIKIIIAGVGGQGTLVASKLLGRIFLNEGYDVKVSEVHGMSQRGGSVVTYVSCGDKVYAPIIDEGEADYLVSFELLEAARWAGFVKNGGTIITNTQRIDPMPVILKKASYPSDILKKLDDFGVKVDAFDAAKVAALAGNHKAVNIVLMGRLSRYFDFDESEWKKAIKESVPEKFLELNMAAWEMGRGETVGC